VQLVTEVWMEEMVELVQLVHPAPLAGLVQQENVV
jgi:hypothetical protein